MKKLIFIMHITSAAPLHAGLIPIGAHVDIRWRWESSAGWTCQAVTDSGGEMSRATGEVFLPLSDKPYVAGGPGVSGARFTRPASSAFAFTGVSAGQPLWIAVQGTPGIGEAWPGLENNQPAGSFGSYIPADSRVSQTMSRPWIKVSLTGYRHPGIEESHFSMWTTSTGSPPKVWMSTYDPNVVNAYYFTEGSHTHMNWGFSVPGIHRVTLRASAFAGPGETNPTGSSAEHTVTFAIGAFAQWQAASFTNAELDDVAISGADADADHDATPNLLEFAFGLDPKNGANVPVASGLGMPRLSLIEENGTFSAVLEYARRRAGSDLYPPIYSPVFSDSLADAVWVGESVVTTVEEFTGDGAALNPVWEKATVRKSFGTVRPTRVFARVGVGFSE